LSIQELCERIPDAEQTIRHLMHQGKLEQGTRCDAESTLGMAAHTVSSASLPLISAADWEGTRTVAGETRQLVPPADEKF